jgi:anti-anti-sigma factor
MNLTVTEKQSGGDVYILEMKGFIDTSTSSELEDAMKKLYGENKTKIVIDLAGTEFVSSAGWGAMVAYLRKVRTNGGDIKLSAMTEKVGKVFKLMEFNSLMESFATSDEAAKSFKN